MSDLISRCELFNRLATIPAPPEANEFKAKIYEVVQGMETADRPQGEWMHDTSSPIAYRCTACNTLQHWSVIQNGRYHFCPNCGAMMKGADDEID